MGSGHRNFVDRKVSSVFFHRLALNVPDRSLVDPVVAVLEQYFGFQVFESLDVMAAFQRNCHAAITSVWSSEGEFLRRNGWTIVHVRFGTSPISSQLLGDVSVNPDDYVISVRPGPDRSLLRQTIHAMLMAIEDDHAQGT